MDDGGSRPGRREFFAGMGAMGASALAGCTDRLWSQAEQTDPEQVSLSIKTVPADDDTLAAKLLSQFRDNLQAAGIDVAHEPIAPAELNRDVLLTDDYDIFVYRHPGLDEYDAVHGLLHSQFVSERGWQNPFYFSEITTDDYLDAQRQADESTRTETLQTLFDHLELTAPYTAIAYPELVGGRQDTLDISSPPRSPLEYIELLAGGSTDGSADRPLDVGVYGEGLTQRLNPIVVDRNGIDGLLELVYDPLVRRDDDGAYPWLAAEVEWEETDELAATVRLREGLQWHDGTALDADDVRFTYRFLADTSLGEVDSGVPAPRYRGRQTLVDEVTTAGSRTVRFSFGETSRRVAARTFSVPVLPEHIWADRSGTVATRLPEALQTDNDEPIGSGLVAYAESTPNSEIVFEPFDEHVLFETDDRPAVLEDGFQFDGLRFRVAPNAGAMVEALVDGETDVTVSPISPEHAESIRDSASASAIAGPTDAFYMVGYNTQHPQLGNPHFRQLLSRLIDREFVVAEFFDGLAESPASAAALFGIPDPEWEDNETPTTLDFPGTDGEISVSRVRSLFEAVGYRYHDEILIE